MAKREVVFSGFSGLFAFGLGVAVGANWPRASNFVGFILQRLGFELTDLALWMWDPEKSAVREAEIIPVKPAKAKKRAQALVIQDHGSIQKKVGAKAKKSGRSPGNQSGEGGGRTTRRKGTNGRKPWIRPEGLNGSSARANGGYADSPLIKSDKAESRARCANSSAADVSLTQPERIRIRTAGKKPKRAMGKAKRKTSSSGRARKISTFRGSIRPAEAVLNQ